MALFSPSPIPYNYDSSSMMNSTVLTPTPAPVRIVHPENRCEFSPSPSVKRCVDTLYTNSTELERMIPVGDYLCTRYGEFRFGMTLDHSLCICESYHDRETQITTNDQEVKFAKIWCSPRDFSDITNPYAILTEHGQLIVREGAPVIHTTTGADLANDNNDDEDSSLFGGIRGPKKLWRANKRIYAKIMKNEGKLVLTRDGELKITSYSDETCVFWEANIKKWEPYEPPEPTPYPTITHRPSATVSPTLYPTTYAPSKNLPLTYYPGMLEDNIRLGIRLSEGLQARLIGRSGNRVQYADGSYSSTAVHDNPDAGGCFDQPNGNYIYVSNSEKDGNRGGVGAFKFSPEGKLINYKMVQTNSNMNCGGGKTPWGTWLTGEEYSEDRDGRTVKGGIWEIDPRGNTKPRRTKFGSAKWESAVCDDRDMLSLQCYGTVDSSSEGALRRYTPNKRVLQEAFDTGDYSNVLHCSGGRLQYLLLLDAGMFQWTNSVGLANANAELKYPNSEGIDFHNGRVYFVSKTLKMLYVLDLDRMSYTQSSTVSGTFDAQPDQISFLVGDDPRRDSFLYFLEDGGNRPGVFGRDTTDPTRTFTILEKLPNINNGSPDDSDETTGLAFCDNHRRMIVAFQREGTIFEISRKDGRPLYGASVNIKYHETGGFNKEDGEPLRLSASKDSDSDLDDHEEQVI